MRRLSIGFLWLIGAAQVAAAPPDPPTSRGAIETVGHRDVEPLITPSTESFVLSGATVLTAAGARHEPGYVAVTAGRISAVGAGVPPATLPGPVIDARGQFLTPGLIDAHSHLGVYPSPGFKAHSDGNEATAPTTGGVWAEHGLWPQDPGIERAIAGGTTTALILPGSANLIGGRGVTVHLVPTRGSRAMRFPGAPDVLKMACGENPKRVYGGKAAAPSTRMGNLRGQREAFAQAQRYRDEWRRWEEKKAAGASDLPAPPARDLQLETLAEVLDGRILVQWHCYRADDMLHALELADEAGFAVRTFHHALEAYKIRDVLAARKVAVATWADWWGFKIEAYDGIEENAALLHQADVTTVIKSDSDLDIQRLNQEAAKALASARAAGIAMSDDDALRLVTANPAWALGIEREVGTIEVGKRADLVLWDADPLSVYARAMQVFVDGALRWDRQRPALPWSDFQLGQELDISAPLSPGARPQFARASGPPLELTTGSGCLALRGSAIAWPDSAPSAGTVVIDGGKIVAAGADPPIPASCRTIEVRDRVITPGLIDAGSDLGLDEIDLEDSTHDSDAGGTQPVRADFRVADGYNPRATLIPVARRGGVTRAVVLPSGGTIAGQAAAVRLLGDDQASALIERSVALVGALEETAAGTLWSWRELFDAARPAPPRGPLRDPRWSPRDLAALQPVISGQRPLLVAADRASDIEALLRFGAEQRLRLIVRGASEGHLVADALARARVGVIVDPQIYGPGGYDQIHARADGPARLARAGVVVAIGAGGAHNLRKLRQLAGNAVRGGMSWQSALAAITSAPARLFGLPGGRIAAGEPADLAIWSGDPLELSTRLEALVIDGRPVALRSRQSDLLERYRTLPAHPPAALPWSTP